MSPRQHLSHHPQMKCCLRPPCPEGAKKRRQTLRDGEESKKIITMTLLAHREVCNLQINFKFMNGKIFPSCEIRCSSLMVNMFNSVQSGPRVVKVALFLFCKMHYYEVVEREEEEGGVGLGGGGRGWV